MVRMLESTESMEENSFALDYRLITKDLVLLPFKKPWIFGRCSSLLPSSNVLEALIPRAWTKSLDFSRLNMGGRRQQSLYFEPTPNRSRLVTVWRWQREVHVWIKFWAWMTSGWNTNLSLRSRHGQEGKRIWNKIRLCYGNNFSLLGDATSTNLEMGQKT